MDSLREELWSSDSPPGSEIARERVILRATEELGGSSRMDRGRPGRRILAVAAGVLILLAATPQGRDAVSWAADLVGIGEVGGPPASTLPEEAPEPSRDPIVFATGTAPDGDRFELFAYRSGDTPIPGGATCVQTRLVGLELGSPVGFGAICFGAGPTEQGVRIGEFSESGLRDYGFVGGEVRLDAERVVVEYTTADGQNRSVDSTVADLDGDLAERIAIPNPTSFFVAFLPAAPNIRELCDYDIRVTALDDVGQPLASDGLSAGCRITPADERIAMDIRRACEAQALELPADKQSEICAEALSGSE